MIISCFLHFKYISSMQMLSHICVNFVIPNVENYVLTCRFALCKYIYPVLCPKLTLIQPTWSAYPYHLVFLIWYPYSLVFLIWYPHALISLYGNTDHCSGCGVAMGCYGLSIVPKTSIVTSHWYDRYCFAGYTRTWARHPTTPWQRECTAITDFQSINSL